MTTTALLVLSCLAILLLASQFAAMSVVAGSNPDGCARVSGRWLRAFTAASLVVSVVLWALLPPLARHILGCVAMLAIAVALLVLGVLAAADAEGRARVIARRLLLGAVASVGLAIGVWWL